MKSTGFQSSGLLLAAILLAACNSVPVTIVVTATPDPDTGVPTWPDIEIDPVGLLPHPVLGDRRVRQAIAYCTDRIELIQSVYPWLEDPTQVEADSVLPRDHWAYIGDEPSFPRYPYDPQEGRALLDAAGWTLGDGAAYRTNLNGDELALKLTTSNTTFRQTWAETWEAQLQDCGVRLLRLHTSPDWFLGEATGLQRRDFELAAFAWILGPGFDWRDAYACERAPNANNDWQGANYTGWCNQLVDRALSTIEASLKLSDRRAAFQVLQEEIAEDLPIVPLFQRLDVYAVSPALQNFAPNVSEAYTWNAAQWLIPGQDTLTILQGREPRSLLPTNTAYEAEALLPLIYGSDFTTRDYDFQPVTLESFPSMDGVYAFANIVRARPGDLIVDINNELRSADSDVRVFDLDGQPVRFDDRVWLKQYIVTYRFQSGLTWADGMPVTREDYRLAYTLTCNPSSAMPDFLRFNDTCTKIESVEFLTDSVYTVTWRPGFQALIFQLPPFSRLPAHLILSDGRQLADVPYSDWPDLPELAQTPLGIGPYTVARWEPGQFIQLTPNPYYLGGPPATPNLIVRFVDSPEQAIALLTAGAADILTPSAFDITADAPGLLQAEADGKIRVHVVPLNIYEHVDFNLFLH